MTTQPNPKYYVRLAENQSDLQLAQKLRHRVFVQELGASSTTTNALEIDQFDEHADHLLLFDLSRDEPDQVVGVYRLMASKNAQAAGQFSCEQEYDLSPLLSSRRKLLELGRSCLDPDYRGGTAMMYLWRALNEYIERTQTEILFGVASFHGTNIAAYATALTFLHQRHLASNALCVQSRAPVPFVQQESIDPKTALRAIPPLIKAYLRLGGKIGNGAFIDNIFNTVDVCMILDLQEADVKQRALYQKDRG